MRLGACLLLGSFVLLPARAAYAQDAPPSAPGDEAASNVDPAQEAKQQYAAGAEAYAAKRFVEAALHFEAAASHRPHAAALYNAALAWEQSNRPERAADAFSRALDVPGLSAAQAQNARARIAVLEKTMGTLDVVAPDGWRVQLDANTEVPTPGRVHAAPGVHQLTILAPDTPIRHRDVTLELGKTSRLDLSAEPPPAPTPPPAPKVEAPPPPPPPPAPPPPEEWWNARRGIGVGVVGLGVATLAGALILGLNANDARDAYNAAPSQSGYDHASSLQTWTNVTLLSGVVLAAGGAALVLWPTPKKAAPPSEARLLVAPTLGGATLRGAF
jgi:tetratricopeptide (TPR) repeat protein